MIICIGREFGSGGHEIGKRLAENMNLSFYDSQLVEASTERSRLPVNELEKVDEKKANPLLHDVRYEAESKELRGLSTNDLIFRIQSDIILELAKKGDCVFVGRCSDYILKQAGIAHISLFITAPFSDRVKRKMKILQKDEKTVNSLVRKTDRRRKAYYNYYTNRSWGKPSNYDFCINSSALGIGETVFLLRNMALTKQFSDMEMWQKEREKSDFAQTREAY